MMRRLSVAATLALVPAERVGKAVKTSSQFEAPSIRRSCNMRTPVVK